MTEDKKLMQAWEHSKRFTHEERKMLVDAYDQATKESDSRSNQYSRIRTTILVGTIGIPSALSSNLSTDDLTIDIAGTSILFGVGLLLGMKLDQKFLYKQRVEEDLQKSIRIKKRDLILQFNKESHSLTDYDSLLKKSKTRVDSNLKSFDSASKTILVGSISAFAVIIGFNMVDYVATKQKEFELEKVKIKAENKLDDLVSADNEVKTPTKTGRLNLKK